MTAQHPEPPAGFTTSRGLLVRRFPGPWTRIHRVGLAPLYFGRSASNRFDAPAGEFGVLYVARDAHGAFIETFGHATGVRVVTPGALAARALVDVVTSRPLRLVDLRSKGLARMGADASLTSGPDYALAQRWALALHQHQRQVDGLLYRARHDPRRACAAIFDRAADAVSVTSRGALLEPGNATLLGELLDTYRFALADGS